MLNLTVSRKTSVPTTLLRNWIATGDARCPLVCVWSNSQTAANQVAAAPAIVPSPDATSEYAQCA